MGKKCMDWEGYADSGQRLYIASVRMTYDREVDILVSCTHT